MQEAYLHVEPEPPQPQPHADAPAFCTDASAAAADADLFARFDTSLSSTTRSLLFAMKAADTCTHRRRDHIKCAALPTQSLCHLIPYSYEGSISVGCMSLYARVCVCTRWMANCDCEQWSWSHKHTNNCAQLLHQVRTCSSHSSMSVPRSCVVTLPLAHLTRHVTLPDPGLKPTWNKAYTIIYKTRQQHCSSFLVPSFATYVHLPHFKHKSESAVTVSVSAAYRLNQGAWSRCSSCHHCRRGVWRRLDLYCWLGHEQSQGCATQHAVT